MAVNPVSHGYWLVDTSGQVYPFSVPQLGGTEGMHLSAPIIGIAAISPGGGYWLVGADGGVFAFGSASYEGGMAGVQLHAPVVGILPFYGGYWLVGADGGSFAFSAPPLRSLFGTSLNAPITSVFSDTEIPFPPCPNGVACG
jgi:hypothetical protein